MTPVAKEGEKATFQQGSAQKAKTGQVWLTNQVRDVWDLNHRQAQVLMLPTPRTSDTKAQPSGNTPEDHLRKKPGREVVADLAIIAENGLLETGGRLLPTPRASDGTKGGPNQRGSKGDLMLPIAVHQLLPTPRTSDTNGAGKHGDGGPDLRTAITLLQTPSVADAMGGHLTRSGKRSNEKLLPGQAKEMATNWGPYEPAVRRWELASGRPAPAPTEPNRNGKPKLSARFDEWLMGAPEGWITDIPGITWNEKIKACGNGVVPQQAAAALKDMLTAFEETPHATDP
jgi:DNA (cytosine-5)-methyltransferase 1